MNWKPPKKGPHTTVKLIEKRKTTKLKRFVRCAQWAHAESKTRLNNGPLESERESVRVKEWGDNIVLSRCFTNKPHDVIIGFVCFG